jgi:hypothetical protein
MPVGNSPTVAKPGSRLRELGLVLPLFVQLFGTENGHARMVYGVQSLPIGTPVVVEVIFEIR